MKIVKQIYHAFLRFWRFLKAHRRPHFSFSKYFTRIPSKIEFVTAVVPNYNYARYLQQRIKSIINQKYPVSELIILDDCSTDDSMRMIEQIIKKINVSHPHIATKIIKNKVNSGSVFNQWAKAFEQASGNYIWICEADDSCSPFFLKKLMPYFTRDKKVVVAYTESCMIDENGKRLMSDFRGWVDYKRSGHWKKSFITDGKEDLRNYQAINNTIANVSGVVFKNDQSIAFKKYLDEAKEFHLAGDWYFYYKVLLHGKLAYEAESLNAYRSHPGSVSKVTDNITHYCEIQKVQDSIMSDIQVSKTTREIVMRRRAELRKEWRISDKVLKYLDYSLEKTDKKLKNTNQTILSVIIPVHNTEKYLTTCLESIFKNLPRGAEVIAIDDASIDGSSKILQLFHEKHPELKISTFKKTKGAAFARNYGLQQAKGQYISFIDSDDFISPYFFQVLLGAAIAEGSDLAHCDINIYSDSQHFHIENMESGKYQNQRASILDCVSASSPCNKIFKRELFSDESFPQLKMNEDVAIIPNIIMRAKKITYIPTPLYYYVQHNDSVQHEAFSIKRLAIFDAIKYCLSKTSDDGQRHIIYGLLVARQILQTMLWISIDEKNKKRRRYLLQKFCDSLHELGLDCENVYLRRYQEEVQMPRLLAYIQKGNASSLDRYIRCRSRLKVIRES